MGTTLIPPTSQQTLTALQEANRVKDARFKLGRRMFALPVRESHLFAADLLDDLPDVLVSMRLDKFLGRVRKCGPVELERLATCAGVSPVALLGELSPNRRAGLSAGLRMRGLSWTGKERAA